MEKKSKTVKKSVNKKELPDNSLSGRKLLENIPSAKKEITSKHIIKMLLKSNITVTI